MIAKLYAGLVLGTLSVALLATPGCARAKAKTAPEVPALDMPAPPPRDVEVAETEPPPPMPLPQEPARNTPPRRAAPAAPQQPPRNNEAPRVEPPKAEPVPVIEAPKPAEEAPKPPDAPTLQTTPAQADMAVERSIRATMQRASNDLNHIDYRVLNSDARTQYDTAKRFINQADAALGRRNLEYARTLADKAATLAAQLKGR